MERPASDELERIRTEYNRRATAIPPGLYGWDRPVNQFFHHEISRAVIRELVLERSFPLDGRKVLDVGCGGGQWLLQFALWGAYPEDLAGIDLSETRISRARKSLPVSELYAGDASQLRWPDAHFDLVSQFTVFTSILSMDLKRAVAGEMLRVSKPSGLILWYDFRVDNPRNKNVRGIRAGEIRALFPGCSMRLRTLTLAPPLARLIVPVSQAIALALQSIPFLRTHYLAVIQKRV